MVGGGMPDTLGDGALVAVSVIGTDRPGIVARVTKALYERGCNLEDVSSTILRGHFSMVLIVRVPRGVQPQQLEDALDGVSRDMDLVVTARGVDEADPRVTAPTHMVSVYGADKPGIVYKVAEELAALGANVTDLTSRVLGAPGEVVYALMLEVAVGDAAALEAGVKRVKDALGIDASVHEIETDLL